MPADWRPDCDLSLKCSQFLTNYSVMRHYKAASQSSSEPSLTPSNSGVDK